MLLASNIATDNIASLISTESAIALLALTVMEIVLGIDNIVFIAIITGRLPVDKRPFARRIGLALAMIMRIALLLAIGWLMGLSEALFLLSDFAPIESFAQWVSEDEEIDAVTGRDLILLAGGLFLLYTAVREIHHKIEGDDEHQEGHSSDLPPQEIDGGPSGAKAKTPKISVANVLFRIAVMDVIFSLDSVMTAVGMAGHVEIMIIAVVVSVGIMIVFANQISNFVQDHPTVKMLALSFLILISVVLLSEAVGQPISKGYVYFAMAFSLTVEFLNLKMHSKRRRPSAGQGEVGTVRPTSSQA
jgi:predicted tellurium resistance membrane protein TerC